MIKYVVKVSLNGQMETHMMVYGKIVKEMDMVPVQMLKMKIIKEIGN